MTTTPAFHVGDPYIKVDQGFARLPGTGYEALHPELKDLNPEDYPDIHKMAILADVAPYSREYQVFPSCLHQNHSRARAGDRRCCRHSPIRATHLFAHQLAHRSVHLYYTCP
jgi:hypothetical protein